MKVHAFMMPELLRSTFQATGIFPFNLDIFTNMDFEPVKSFSHKMHFPDSFPAEVRSSSPAVALDSDSDIMDLDGDSSKSDFDTLGTDLDWDTV